MRLLHTPLSRCKVFIYGRLLMSSLSSANIGARTGSGLLSKSYPLSALLPLFSERASGLSYASQGYWRSSPAMHRYVIEPVLYSPGRKSPRKPSRKLWISASGM
jgi:hypothetical protein